MNDLKNFDFVIFGATGFTGKLVVEYALENYSDSEISWAIAGRNTEKLQDLKNKMNLPEEIQIFKVLGAKKKLCSSNSMIFRKVVLLKI